MKIALSGKMGAGKNEILKIMQELYPKDLFAEIKMAGPIYGAMYALQEYLNLEKEKEGKILQFLGAHYRDLLGQDFWLNKVEEKFPVTSTTKFHQIITDIRYPNELQKVKEWGFTTIRVLRQDNLRLAHAVGRDTGHSSEIALDKTCNVEFDYVINNHGDIEMLTGAVYSIVESLRRTR